MGQDHKFDGPAELAIKIREYRERNKSFFNAIHGPCLLESTIENVISLVYHATLHPEEGRYPRFRVVITNQIIGHWICLGQSSPGDPSFWGHPLDSLDAIRRLAPAIAGRETALIIGTGHDVDNAPKDICGPEIQKKQLADRLYARGIVDFGQLCAGPPHTLNRLYELEVFPPGSLILRADGPGDIRAMIFPSPVFHLRAGKIRTLESLDLIQPFGDLMLDLCKGLHNSVKTDPRIKAFVPNPEDFAKDLSKLWATTISTAVEERHGGAFVITEFPNASQLKVKYKTEGGILTAFRETLHRSLESTASSGPKYLAIFKHYWLSQQSHLRRVAKNIGRLSATDGCVVFDRNLNVRGFGAKIEWNPEDRFLPLIDPQKNQEISDEEIKQEMGTRRKSACRLVQVTPGAIVFVVSQDGDLSVFYSDNSHAYRVENIDVWSSASERV